MNKAIKEVDIIVGGNIRMMRVTIGLSQEKLAESLGVTFQQVQKYEKGTNRVSASTLHAIAKTLNVSISSLFGEAACNENPAIPALTNQQMKASRLVGKMDYITASKALNILSILAEGA